MSCHILHTDTLPVPVKVYVEKRHNSRVSLASEHIIVRLPMHLPGEEKNRQLKEYIEWAQAQLKKKNYYQHKERGIAYYQNKVLRICETDFKIEIFEISDARNKLNYRNDEIIRIFLKKAQEEKTAVQEIRRLLIKFTEKYFTAHIAKRTHHFNDLFFREKIAKVRLNHTVSKWGSCSHQRNIMFSTKLLLLPLPVIDYVIVHELAHLKEMNHSDKFWNEVQQAMPEYKKWDRWLTRRGAEYDF